MAEVFEDEFMDVQTGLLSLCLELAGRKRVEKIYVYGLMEEETDTSVFMFNAFFDVVSRRLIKSRHDVLTASALVGNPERVKEFLRTGAHDLVKIPGICKKYGKPAPTEIRLTYDCRKKSLDAKYRYSPIWTEETEVTPDQIFMDWKEEIAAALR